MLFKLLDDVGGLVLVGEILTLDKGALPLRARTRLYI